MTMNGTTILITRWAGRLSSLMRAKRDGSLPMRLNYYNYDPEDYPPIEADYRLRYKRGWTDDPMAWNVYSPTRGRGHFVLVRQ